MIAFYGPIPPRRYSTPEVACSTPASTPCLKADDLSQAMLTNLKIAPGCDLLARMGHLDINYATQVTLGQDTANTLIGIASEIERAHKFQAEMHKHVLTHVVKELLMTVYRQTGVFLPGIKGTIVADFRGGHTGTDQEQKINFNCIPSDSKHIFSPNLELACSNKTTPIIAKILLDNLREVLPDDKRNNKLLRAVQMNFTWTNAWSSISELAIGVNSIIKIKDLDLATSPSLDAAFNATEKLTHVITPNFLQLESAFQSAIFFDLLPSMAQSPLGLPKKIAAYVFCKVPDIELPDSMPKNSLKVSTHAARNISKNMRTHMAENFIPFCIDSMKSATGSHFTQVTLPSIASTAEELLNTTGQRLFGVGLRLEKQIPALDYSLTWQALLTTKNKPAV